MMGLLSQRHCVEAEIVDLRFPVCTFPGQVDPHVSALFQIGVYPEKHQVERVVRLLRQLAEDEDVSGKWPPTRLAFVDLGAFIGTYSLPVAYDGIRVGVQTTRFLKLTLRMFSCFRRLASCRLN